eukprot:6459499-Amphidinium_carterae.1
MHTEEYLVQHSILSSFDRLGQIGHHIYMEPAVELSHGSKDVSALGGCAASFGGVQLLPPTGAQGAIRMFHQTYDRGVGQALLHVVSGHQRMHHVNADGSSIAVGAAGKVSIHLHSYNFCAAHDGQNSLKWGVASLFQDKDAVKNLYVAVMSQRSCYYKAVTMLWEFIQTVLVLVPRSQCASAEVLKELWTCLGVDASLSEVLSERMRLQWKGGKLLVLDTYLSEEGASEELTAALLELWKFPCFNAGRWCSVGPSTRGLIRALLSGGGKVIHWLRARGHLSDYYAGGFDKLDVDLQKRVLVACLSSYLSESFLAHVLEDNRLAKNFDEVLSTVIDEFGFLASISMEVMNMLGSIAGIAGYELYHDVLAAAMRAWAYLHQRCLHRAQQLPWSLCRGDLGANLDRLVRADVVQDPTSSTLQHLVRVGWNREQLVQCLVLLGEAGWTTALAERQHGCMASIRRHHPDMTGARLKIRAHLLSCRQLMPSLTPELKQLQRLRLKTLKLIDAKPGTVTGRHLFL